MIDSGESKLPLQYEDGPDYCTVRDAQGRDFALTMQPDLMKAMERALSAEITSFMRDPTKDQKNVWRALQYEIEGVILRRLHAKRIEGYTLEMSQELTALYFAFRPDKVALTTWQA